MFLFTVMILSLFTKSRMFGFLPDVFFMYRFRFFRDRFDDDLFCIRKTQRQFIAVDPQFHRITERRIFYDRNMFSGYHSHIKKVLA